MVADEIPSVVEPLAGASSYLLTYLGIALVLGVVGSWLLARRIKRQTLGLEPSEIAGLAEHREAMLYGIAEGVIALDPNTGSPWSTTSPGDCSTCRSAPWEASPTCASRAACCDVLAGANGEARPARATRW